MPSVRVTNSTSSPLNICLKHVCALHFENGVQPGDTIKLKPGKVWFTLEALVDTPNRSNRYSAAKSAATIAIISVAALATVAAAGAPMVSGAAGAGMSSAGSSLVAGIATIASASTRFIAAHAATAAKLSAVLLPRAMDRLYEELSSKEHSEVQKEVMAILSGPTVTDDMRKSGIAILDRLERAASVDKQRRAEERSKARTELPPDAVFREHGIFVSERRRFDIREKNGRMFMVDLAKEEAEGELKQL